MNWLRSEELRRGISSENILADLLSEKVSGLQIVQVLAAPGANKGPRVRSKDFGDLIELPAHDIKATFADIHFDIQVKLKGGKRQDGKDGPTWRRNGGFYEHGFDLPVYRGYQHLYEFTATRCLLLIVEEGSGDGPKSVVPRVLANWLHRAKPWRIDPEPRRHANNGMAYWRRDQFIPVMDASLSPFQFMHNSCGEMLLHRELREEMLMRPRPVIQRPLSLPRQGLSA